LKNRQILCFIFAFFYFSVFLVVAREEIGYEFLSDEKIGDLRLDVDQWLNQTACPLQMDCPLPSILCSEKALSNLPSNSINHAIPQVVQTYCMEKAARKWVLQRRGRKLRNATKTLDLRSQKGFQSQEIPFVLKALGDKSSDIQQLYLSTISQPILEALKPFTQLRIFRIEGGDMTQMGQSFSNFLKGNVNLKTLLFEGTKMGPEVLESLLQGIPSGLIELTLRGTSIGAEGAKVLAGKFNFLNIGTLVLDANAIGDEGLVYLSNALLNARNLQNLSLQNNGITDAGIPAFVEKLPKSRLSTLSLKGNTISSAQRQAIYDALHESTGKKIHHTN